MNPLEVVEAILAHARLNSSCVQHLTALGAELGTDRESAWLTAVTREAGHWPSLQIRAVHATVIEAGSAWEHQNWLVSESRGAIPQSDLLIQVSNDGQFGRLSFFKNAAKRGSPCRFSSRGSKFVKVTLPSR